MRPLVQLGFEIGFDGGDDSRVVGDDFGGEAGGYVAVAVNEELFEVPEDAGFGIGGCAVVIALEEVVEIFAERFFDKSPSTLMIIFLL